MRKRIDITDRDSIELLARMPIQALEGFFNDQEAEAEELARRMALAEEEERERLAAEKARLEREALVRVGAELGIRQFGGEEPVIGMRRRFDAAAFQAAGLRESALGVQVDG